MKHKKTTTTIAILFFGLGAIQAQESPTATGGEATGTGGTVSYSVGQVVYTTNTGANGSLAEGVQQPFEISTLVGLNEKSIHLEMSVYPNPTSNYLNLKTGDYVNLSYQLYDIQGKTIENNKLTNNSTRIEMKALPAAIYFLKVNKDNKSVKTFKIIKN